MTEPLFSALDEDSPPVVDTEFADLPPPPIHAARRCCWSVKTVQENQRWLTPC